MKYLILDMTNLMYRGFYAHKNEDVETIFGLAVHSILIMIYKYWRKHEPVKVVPCFDRPSWRKDYTQSEKCKSKRIYKANRRKDMSPNDFAKYQMFLKYIEEFEFFLRDYTGCYVLANEGLEADDLIAGFTQAFPEDEHVIISSDRDMTQLIASNVTVVDPATDKARNLEEWNNDRKFMMFVKCIRGDAGDNVMSAFSGVRLKRLEKAYSDPYEMTNIMQTVIDLTPISDPMPEAKTLHTVQDLYEENQLLMDLCKQPNEVKMKMYKTIFDRIDCNKQFSYFHMMKFFGKHDLKKLTENTDHFMKMLV